MQYLLIIETSYCRCVWKSAATTVSGVSTGVDEDLRPLFEKFVCDLLFTFNRVEFPASESMLQLLVSLLLQYLSYIQSSHIPAGPTGKGQAEFGTRMASIDYFGALLVLF